MPKVKKGNPIKLSTRKTRQSKTVAKKLSKTTGKIARKKASGKTSMAPMFKRKTGKRGRPAKATSAVKTRKNALKAFSSGEAETTAQMLQEMRILNDKTQDIHYLLETVLHVIASVLIQEEEFEEDFSETEEETSNKRRSTSANMSEETDEENAARTEEEAV